MCRRRFGALESQCNPMAGSVLSFQLVLRGIDTVRGSVREIIFLCSDALCLGMLDSAVGFRCDHVTNCNYRCSYGHGCFYRCRFRNTRSKRFYILQRYESPCKVCRGFQVDQPPLQFDREVKLQGGFHVKRKAGERAALRRQFSALPYLTGMQIRN